VARQFDNREPQLIRRPPLSVSKLRYMLAACVRRRAIFAKAKEQLRLEDFPTGALAYRVVWAAALDYHKSHEALPSQNALRVEVGSKIENDDSLTPEDIEEIEEVLGAIYEFKLADLQPKVASKHLRQFKEDCVYRDLQVKVSGSFAPSDLLAMLGQAKEAVDQLQIIEAAPVDIPFPADFTLDEIELVQRRSGLSFVDEFTGGGMADGEIMLVAGPFGGCKSVMAIQLSMSLASVFYTNWVQGERQGALPLVYLATYEDSPAEIKARALSNKGRISWTRLVNASRNPLSTGGDPETLQPYEQDAYREAVQNQLPIRGELERLTIAKRQLNRNWRLLDFTGSGRSRPTKGQPHLFAEIRTMIEGDLEARDHSQQYCLGAVILDYAKAAVSRFIAHTGRRNEDMRLLTDQLPYHFKHELCKPLGGFGVVFQQLDSKAQRFGPGQIASHMDTPEGKMIGENSNFCLSLGKRTSDNLFVVDCSKARRAALVGSRVCRFEGDYYSIADTGGAWLFDPQSRRIIARREAEALRGGIADVSFDPTPPRPAAAGSRNSYAMARGDA
jgi:hypothetical protein